MSRSCTHIIIRDKFTSGYIRFLLNHSFNMEHYFITFEGDYTLDVQDEHLFIEKDYSSVIEKHSDLLEQSEKIVVAAFFDEALALLKMPQKYWDKIWIQFWGGDIYRFTQSKEGFINSFKQKMAWALVKIAIEKCAGVLTLVEGDYPVIEKIFKVQKKHLVVQVPDDFYEINHLDYPRLNVGNTSTKKRILIGNSATIENQHLDVFYMLKDKVDENTEIVVPLSYGLDDYRKTVLNKGKELFKENFHPVLDFMNREDYISMLSKIDVAIFNNNRQQATGNIIILANLDKKLYLRNDTSMWSFFKKYGFIFHNAEDLKKEFLHEIIEMKEREKKANRVALNKMEEEGIDQWKDFLGNS